jgi:hypothetical protein
MGFVCFVIFCAVVFIIWYVFSWIVETNDVTKPKKDVFSGGEAGDIIIERSDGMKEEIMKVCMKVQGKWVEMPNIERVCQIDENGYIIGSYIREKKNKEEKNMREIKVGDKVKVISITHEDTDCCPIVGNIYTVIDIRKCPFSGSDYAIFKEANSKGQPLECYLFNCKLVDEKEKQFKKSDLKNGDIVELRNGERYVYIEKYKDWSIYSIDNDEVIVNLKDGDYSRLADYNDDLRYEDRKNCKYDIMRILDMSEFCRKPKWTWEREKTEEMTLEEVCQELGRDVKIVKEH